MEDKTKMTPEERLESGFSDWADWRKYTCSPELGAAKGAYEFASVLYESQLNISEKLDKTIKLLEQIIQLQETHAVTQKESQDLLKEYEKKIYNHVILINHKLT